MILEKQLQVPSPVCTKKMILLFRIVTARMTISVQTYARSMVQQGRPLRQASSPLRPSSPAHREGCRHSCTNLEMNVTYSTCLSNKHMRVVQSWNGAHTGFRTIECPIQAPSTGPTVSYLSLDIYSPVNDLRTLERLSFS